MKKELQLANYVVLGDTKEIKKMFQQDKNIDVNFRDNFGLTALDLAIDNKNIIIINMLLDYGASFDNISEVRFANLVALRGGNGNKWQLSTDFSNNKLEKILEREETERNTICLIS